MRSGIVVANTLAGRYHALSWSIMTGRKVATMKKIELSRRGEEFAVSVDGVEIGTFRTEWAARKAARTVMLALDVVGVESYMVHAIGTKGAA
jgi:hypothetical protein